MSSPGVIQAEVDALLAAIARPPAGDETPRARADFLLSLMDLPEEARDRTGSNGRSVRAAAMEALMELGYPYALEVHPDVLEAVRQQAGDNRGPKQDFSWRAVGVTVLSMVVQLVFVALLSGPRGNYPLDQWESLRMIQVGLVVTPPLLALFGQWIGVRSLQRLGVMGLTLQGLLWLIPAASAALGGLSLSLLTILLFPWHLTLAAAYMMSPKPEPEDASAPRETLPTEPS
ncbi:hypothetical protein JY651_41635 [Pyxidicoccus parkwayensis]|uniref:Uncharacterized protein n=1 Tax=Pyxidicoccus parkwayensis TaxID=2813578 RepID=A0ABX7NTA4_9BACT|nr:hypothetical protein [Pyxidicoccus parkwaysis]QSQ21609.1 hypothetical protein JY651_41635 [Pyxidicoccus parkwaysis]